jgi:hypothetical protein
MNRILGMHSSGRAKHVREVAARCLDAAVEDYAPVRTYEANVAPSHVQIDGTNSMAGCSLAP